MGLDPIQHQLTLSIVCAVQATGCLLVSRAVAKIRSDWQRHHDVPSNDRIGFLAEVGPRPRPEGLLAIEPQARHPIDLQVWDQQFAVVGGSLSDSQFAGPAPAAIEPAPIESAPSTFQEPEAIDPTNPPTPTALLPTPYSPPTAHPVDCSNLLALTVPQLRNQAKQLGLKNYSRQTKAQLVVAIQRHLQGLT